MEEACLRLRATPDAARQSRQWAEPVLHDWHLDDMADDILFIVNEFVANAVCHTHTSPTLRLERDNGQLRIEVKDQAMFTDPDEQHVDPQSLSGRGLHIVGELAGSWGTELVPGGKVVWAEVPVPT
jgi:anti-sigma regulatory factor (Ser/Thr protein kinase)